MKSFAFFIYLAVVDFILFFNRKDGYPENILTRIIISLLCCLGDIVLAIVMPSNYNLIYTVIIYSTSFLFIIYELIVFKMRIYNRSNKIFFDFIMYLFIVLLILGFLIYYKRFILISTGRRSAYAPYALGSITMIMNLKSVNNKLHSTDNQEKGDWFFKNK